MGEADIVRETALWLWAQWEWDAFLTLTFAPRPSRKVVLRPQEQRHWNHLPECLGLKKRLENRAYIGPGFASARWYDFIEWVEQGGPVWWICAHERHPTGGGVHLHALMGGLGDRWRTALWKHWKERNGLARIEPVTLERAMYVVKYVVKEGRWDASRNLSCVRRASPLFVVD